MTIEDFRKNPALTTRMRELLEDETCVLALRALRDGNPPVDPPVGANELTSVRILSQMTGYRIALEKLREMGEPLIVPEEMEETFEPEIPEA